MWLRKKELCHISVVSHEGKLVVVATDGRGDHWYTVKQDGFEDSYLKQNPEERTGWEDWERLELPNEPDDKSVLERESERNTDQQNTSTYLLRSIYRSQQSAVAPVQLLSALGHVYVFRQSPQGRLWADRFVLDGLTNKLGRKIEVRFKRSGMKHTPKKSSERSSAMVLDSLDFKDIDGEPFFEPTTELSLIENLHSGWFSVVLLPTSEQDQHRWHIFAFNSASDQVEHTSLKASDEGLFELRDHTVLFPEVRTLPGIARTSLGLNGLSIAGGLSATRYDVQRARETDSGVQLLKESVRVMLLVGSAEGQPVALDFSVASDGSLSKFDNSPEHRKVWRSDTRHVMLPLNTLIDTVAIATTEPAPDGLISGLTRGPRDAVIVESLSETHLPLDEPVRVAIEQNPAYNGLYPAVSEVIDGNTFEIDRLEQDTGQWKVVRERETGLVFNGAVTGYRVMPNGRLRITAHQHGLEPGDTVQLINNQSYNGTFPVKPLDERTFVLEGVRWLPGTSISARLQSHKRRGIRLGEKQGSLLFDELPDLVPPFTITLWVQNSDSQWQTNGCLLMLGEQIRLNTVANSNSLDLFTSNIESNTPLRFDPDADFSQWTHLSIVHTGSVIRCCINGSLQAEGPVDQPVPGQNGQLRLAVGGSGDWPHQISELIIREDAYSEQQIKQYRYQPVDVEEKSLLGYWPLNAIIEDSQRKVVDLSRHKHDGLVLGEAHLASIQLLRASETTDTPIIRFINKEPVAVSSRSTYLEQFEFRTDLSSNWEDAEDKPFSIDCQGKRSRTAEQWSDIEASSTQFKKLADGWYQASTTYTIPDDISVIRSFGISEFVGAWQRLEVRKPQLIQLSDSITQLKIDALTGSLAPLGIQAETQKSRDRIRTLELRELEWLDEQKRLADLIEELEERLNNRDASIARNKSAIEQQESMISWTRRQLSLFETQRDGYRTLVDKGSKKVTFYWNNDYSGKSFSRSIGRYWKMPKGWNDELASIRVPKELQLILYEHINFGGGAMVFNTDHNLYHWDIPGKSTNWKNEASSFEIRIRGSKQTDLSGLKDGLEKSEGNVALFRQRLKKQQEKLTELKRFSADRDISGELQQARSSKRVADQRLHDTQQELHQLNSTFLADLSGAQTLTMPTISQSDEKLFIRGARLNFIEAAGRLQLMESSEGQLRVDYVDREGRMRQTAYDTTADAANARFEQWLTDSERACLDCRYQTSAVRLDRRTTALSEWSIDAWFFYPNIDRPDVVTLAGGPQNSHHIIIVRNDDRDEIGSWIGGHFYNSGYDLRSLSPGWHHIAAVARDPSKSNSGDTKGKHTITFYIDGYRVGSPITLKLDIGISSIGNSANGNSNAGKIAEFRLWNIALSEEEVHLYSHMQPGIHAPGLELYLPLSEGSGSIANDLTGNYVATINNAQWAACTTQLGYRRQQSMTFNGSDQWVEFANDEALNPTEMSVSCWTRCTGGEGRWRSVLTSRHASDQGRSDVQGYMFYAGRNDRWQFWVGASNRWVQLSGPPVILDEWVHLAASYADNRIHFFVNGTEVDSQAATMRANRRGPLRIGAGSTEGEPRYFFHGQVAEVCIRDQALDASAFAAVAHQRQSGFAPGLRACIALDSIDRDSSALTTAALGTKLHGTVNGATLTDVVGLPLGPDGSVSAEYSTVGKDRTAMMRRASMTVGRDGVSIWSDQRVDLLDLRWIGNGQFAPTLLGYMEGAPPVPSENLTYDSDYRSYISVSLNLSEDVDFNWTREQDAGLGASIDAYIGSDVSQSLVAAPLGVGIDVESVGVRAGFKGNLDFSYQFQNKSSITSSSSLGMTDSLNVVGTMEREPHFPHLGQRFIPKSVGYALVVSSLADVFVTRLQRTGTMIGYQVLPVENVPPDVNTITFLLNPTYTMCGSLDGMTGSQATSDRFYKHVPDMRAHFGSRYPASYFRLDEAYELKQFIEQQDKNREAYFEQFNSLLVGESGIDQEIDVGQGGADDLPGINLTRGGSDLTDEQKRALAAENEKQAEALESETEERQREQKKKVGKHRKEIVKRIANQEQRSHANASFAAWQKKMEQLQLRAGKKNIVNNYVWDADGGFRSESQSFANSAEHSIGGSFSLNAGLGFEGNFKVLAASVELTAQATVNMTQTMSKTATRSTGVELEVDLRGMETRGVTDHNDNPLKPGEKVNRYRFMSFYLEGSTSNFNDFFDYVVDPEWLAGNSEEARALRGAQGKANKAWRVLHRVTYVERPALQGFGRDLRPVNDLATGASSPNELDSIRQDNAELRAQVASMHAELKKITAALNSTLSANPSQTSLNSAESGGKGQNQGTSTDPATPALTFLNSANRAELEALTGIGPSLASDILNRRQARGQFTAIDELIEIAGIGPVLLEEIRDQLENSLV